MQKNNIIDTKTMLYCIFGNPISQSKSPILHNTLFRKNKINAVYLSFNINDIKKGVEAIRELNIKGASITIPFKQEVMEYLDNIDEQAQSIGSVNTIVNENGNLIGYNTDWYGGIQPLLKHGIENKKIGLIGAGGTALAIAYGIKKNNGILYIINRSKTNGEKLASYFDAKFLSFKEIKNQNFDIIINTTPLGMFPEIDKSPFNKEFLKKSMIVMDVVYNPIDTKLLIEAKKRGCIVIDGLSMFAIQGAKQFELWTGIKPSLELIRKTIIKTLKQ